jgi:tetratricopeptide (TPR) repeat protein
MRFGKICLRIATLGSTLLALSGCSDDTPSSTAPPSPPANNGLPDLSDAIAKRVEGKPEEAIELLRKHNEKSPNSPDILIQLGRALFDSGQFALSGFRLDQALSAGARQELLKESALAYQKAGDAKSAMTRYSGYLKENPDDSATWLAQARLLAQADKSTEALNAFVKATELTTHEDCLVMAELFFEKNLLPQAEHWYKESARKEEGITPRPLLGLLRVKIASKDEENAEALILAIEKSNPKTIEGSGLSEGAADLLRKRRTNELIDRGFFPEKMTITELAAALLKKTGLEDGPVVSRGPKTSPAGTIQPPDGVSGENDPLAPDPGTGTSLADAFATPVATEPDSLEQGRSAFVLGNYTSALLFAREAIKKDQANSEAWRLSSRAHFQLGEVKEAEMTVLEAIRHNPKDMQTHMEYLRIARETLSGPRYLRQLEKSHELFPESTEILWQLARRYHLVERMPVTAGVLYRKLIETAPEGSALGKQAEMELIKIQNF